MLHIGNTRHQMLQQVLGTSDLFFVPPAVLSRTKQGCMLQLHAGLFVGKVHNCFVTVGVQ